MNTITNNQGIAPTGPQVQGPEKAAELKPAIGQTGPADRSMRPAGPVADSKIRPSAPEPQSGRQYLDPDQMREFVAKVAEAIEKASVEPHTVGFTPDPDSKGYLVEIKRVDGTVITRFSPENVLNLNGYLDDLSGMVIDLKT